MSAVKTMVVSLLGFIAVGTVAQADPIPWSSGMVITWTNWSPSGEYVTNATLDPSLTGTVAPTPSTPPPAQPTYTPPPITPTVTPAAAPQPAVSATTFASPAAFSSSAPSSTYDAFLNFGSGPYPAASNLVTGTAQPWYLSPTVDHLYGGVPNAQQQASFTQGVLQDVKQTFALAGLSPQLTLDPTAQANHTLSVVSGASYGSNSNAIGITNVGGSGFSFIDKFNSASSITDLQWALAHNISHELMHAFGLASHPEQTGNYVDAATTSWPVLTDPNATFSTSAAQSILSLNYGRSGSGGLAMGSQLIEGEQQLSPQPVPEPATVLLWSLVGAGVACRYRRRLCRLSA